MARSDHDLVSGVNSASQAIKNLLEREFEQREVAAFASALRAHSEIEQAPIQTKTSPFFRHFKPLRDDLVKLLAESYRRFFKLALAHPSQTEGDAEKWALTQIEPAITRVWQWIYYWYIWACDGESQDIRNWTAPSWLFQISLALVGVGPLKEHHVPDRSSGNRLGLAHTRLILKGARRVFLWELGDAFEAVRNEEIAAAGAIPAVPIGAQTPEQVQRKAPKPHFKGLDGLGPKKTDLSQYMDSLTEKQQLAFSLKYEYELGLAEIASRMEIDRKTAYEHIEAARRKMEQALSAEKRKARRPKSVDE